ncbi:RES domain-containing protein [Bordetella petrii]|nr:RES domain-containing protein [Bordetella petrii]
MIALWRLCNGKDFWDHSGVGGRWHPAEQAVLVLEASSVAAVCAALACAEVGHPRELPVTYHLYQVWIPKRSIVLADVPRRWQKNHRATRAVGQAWLDKEESLALCVPSMSGGRQYLLNTRHADVRVCRVDGRWPHPFEPAVVQVAPMLRRDAEWLALFAPFDVSD